MRTALLLLALSTAGCNPYEEELPRAICQTATRHCRPGEACSRGYCWAEGRVSLTLAAPGLTSVRAVVVALPRREAEPRLAPHARLLADEREPVEVEHGLVTLRFGALPRLPAYALVWDGAHERPCAGVLHTWQRVPTGGSAELRGMLRERWEGECYDLPVPLRFTDRRFFPPLQAPPP